MVPAPVQKTSNSTLLPFLSRLLLFCFVTLCAFFLEGVATVNAFDDASASAVLDKIADYALPGDDRISRTLRDLGYTPTAPEDTWRAFPAARKLESAYKAAEAAKKGDGNRLIAETIRRLSGDVESIRNNPQMSAFADSHPASSTPFRFAAAQSQLVSVDQAAFNVILNIADQTERGALGGAGSILTRDLGLSEADAYEILRSSSSNREALFTAYGKMDESDRASRLQTLGRKLQARYTAAARDTALITALAGLSQSTSSSGRSSSTHSCPAGLDPCLCGAVFVGCRTAATCRGPC